MNSYKELLPSRIPEYLQEDSNLKEYLEVAGELFDEIAYTIDDLENVWDYEKTEIDRLRALARQFALEFPRNIDEELQRSIVRDLHAIYQKSGTFPLVEWIFRLIGWDVTFENAWLLNPERYDPRIKEVFELDDYNPSKKSEIIVTDYDQDDYREFLVGEVINDGNGNYFKGKRFFEANITFPKQEIVGEVYGDDKTRTPDKVGATPYFFIEVSEEDYNIFISDYEDPETGIVYQYTQSEFFNVIRNIFDLFLYDDLRPTHVRVIGVFTVQTVDDERFYIGDEVDDEWEAEPHEIETIRAVFGEEKNSHLTSSPSVGQGYVSGAPLHPYDKDMNLIHQGESESIPICGHDEFFFNTPHEDEFSFWTVVNGTSSLDDYIVVRNPTEIESYLFDDPSSSVYDVGPTKNLVASFDMRGNTEQSQYDGSLKNYKYVMDLDVMFKETTLDSGWSVFTGNLNNITEANAIAFRFNTPVPYDVVLKITYKEQPEWENQ